MSHLWLNIGTAILIIRLGLIGVQGKAVLIISGAHRASEGAYNPYTANVDGEIQTWRIFYYV